MDKENIMRNIIDKHMPLSDMYINVAPEMTNSPDSDEEWKSWFPIESTITDVELNELEIEIGFELPLDYRKFLKYKHFYEFRIYQAFFVHNPIHTWKKCLIKSILKGYPREWLIDLGYIPFIRWHDWGHLCFDTNRNTETKDYPIVLWDHERADEFEDFADNFVDMLVILDEMDRKSMETDV